MTGRDLASMAERVCDDGQVPIADRLVAAAILHRVRHGIQIDSVDLWRLRVAHGRRRREVAALARWYGATG